MPLGPGVGRAWREARAAGWTSFALCFVVAIAKQDVEAVGIGLVMLALIGLGCLYGWWEEVTSAHGPPAPP